MWCLAPLAHSRSRLPAAGGALTVARSAASACAVHTTTTRSSSRTTATLLACRPPSLFATPIRHGSNQSGASRSASRASGNTYRTPKGRPGPNTFHVKEPLPLVDPFAPTPLPKQKRRERAAAARAALPKHDRIDFELDADGLEVVHLKGKDGKRRRLQRVKTPLHKKLALAKAHAAVDQMKWSVAEQSEAERQADEFLARQAHELQAERDQLEQATEGMEPEERQQMLYMFDVEAEQTKQLSREELTALVQQQQQLQAGQQPPSAAEDAPVFGVQTVLKFLAEFDLMVRPPAKAKRASKKSDDPASASAAAADANASDAANPLDQDILVYDVISRFQFADYILVVKAQSARQMRHLAESTYKMARALNACRANPKRLTLEGRGREDWMLVDAGHVWLYFFNRKPVVTLPNASGIFGVSFHLPQPKVRVDAMGVRRTNTDGGGQPGLGQARLQTPAAMLTGSAAQLAGGHSVTFQAHGNPFDPSASSSGAATAAPAGDQEEGEVMEEQDQQEEDARLTRPKWLQAPSASTFSSSSSSSSSAPSVVDPDTEVHETASQINSSMWYEPTPDHPNAKKKSQLNAQQSKKQMEEAVLDGAFFPAAATGRRVIDASFTASSSPALTSGSSSSIDPALALLHASNFVHPVLENLEKNYGDLRVPTAKVRSVQDYAHEDLANGVRFIAAPTDDGKRKGAKKNKKTTTGQRESIEIQEMTQTIVSRVA